MSDNKKQKEKIFIGQGIVKWHRGERIGDRYGHIGLWKEFMKPFNWKNPNENSNNDREPILFNKIVGHFGDLYAEIIEKGEHVHVGDFMCGVFPQETEEKEIFLGQGFFDKEIDQEQEMLVCKPANKRVHHWYDVTNLYKCHNQKVRLYFIQRPDIDVASIPEYIYPIKCWRCDGNGLNPETKKIADGFYSFDDRKKAWKNKLTQEEIDLLIEKRRLKEGSTAEEINKTNGDCHDGINHMILIEYRATKAGVYGECDYCAGDGNYFEIVNPNHYQIILKQHKIAQTEVQNIYRVEEKSYPHLLQLDVLRRAINLAIRKKHAEQEEEEDLKEKKDTEETEEAKQ